MIKKYVKKPVVIEAIQYTGDNLKQVIEFTGYHPKWGNWFKSWREYENFEFFQNSEFKIVTLEGTMSAFPGDYIIKGIQGEFYPCKSDIFKATYDECLV